MGTAKPARSREDRFPANTNDPGTDVFGVSLLALALVTGIGLMIAEGGLVGRVLDGLTRTLFGQGAWGVPVVTGAVGLAMVAGRRLFEVRRLLAGLSLVALGVVGALARPHNGDYFDPEIVPASGGYLGALVAWSLEQLLGQARFVGIGLIVTIGLILCLNAPLRTWPRLLRRSRSAAPTHVLRGSRASSPSVEEGAGELPTTEARGVPRLPVIRGGSASGISRPEPVPREGYELPPLTLLAEPQPRPSRTVEEMAQQIATLEGTLEQFGIDANVVEIATGPTITRYEIQLGPGIRVSRIPSLADNLAMNLAASQVRVEAPIPGKAAIGVEVPNAVPSPVYLREVCDSIEFLESPSKLTIALGQDVSGTNRYADLARMPHLLIGGATNSGKSIALSALIMSLLLRNTPKDVRLVLIDPKRVELTLFDAIPHLMYPVVRDVKEAPGVLRAVWREMDRRYDLFAEAQVRNIDGWNAKASFADRLPYIVVVIDELADLMIQAAAEVETSICRLAQLARATGIHLVVATQRPSVDVITGTIKANISSRIAFAVSSHIDSRTIIDQAGAERLIGRGDMLFMPMDAAKPIRIQGCYVSETEIEAVCRHWREQEKPHYVLNPISIIVDEREAELAASESDPLWEDVVRWVVERGQASTSMIQRRYAIGFQRASRLLDAMEERGIVGPRDGPRPREVLIDPLELEALFGRRSAAPREAPEARVEE